MIRRFLATSPWAPALVVVVVLAIPAARAAPWGDDDATDGRAHRAEPPTGLAGELSDALADRSLRGFRLVEARTNEVRETELLFAREATRVRVWVVPPGSWEHDPPARAERHDVFYGEGPPGSPAATSSQIQALLAELVSIIDGL